MNQDTLSAKFFNSISKPQEPSKGSVAKKLLADFNHAEPIPLLTEVPTRNLLDSSPRALTAPLDAVISDNVIASTEFPDTSVLFKKSARDLCKSEPIDDTSSAPVNGIGKLFLTTPSGGKAHGSAWIINDEWICTCAHNLINRSGWSSNIFFVPGFNQYAGDSADLDASVYQVKLAVVQPRYTEPSLPDVRYRTAFDIAFCQVHKRFDTNLTRIPILTLSDYEVFDSNNFYSIGYPGDTGFDNGQYPWKCSGRFIYQERLDANTTHCPVKATQLGPGVSGCPWITEQNGQHFAVGLSSGGSTSDYFLPETVNPNRIRIMSSKSPYFNQEVFDQLQTSTVRRTFPIQTNIA